MPQDWAEKQWSKHHGIFNNDVTLSEDEDDDYDGDDDNEEGEMKPEFNTYEKYVGGSSFDETGSKFNKLFICLVSFSKVMCYQNAKLQHGLARS